MTKKTRTGFFAAILALVMVLTTFPAVTAQAADREFTYKGLSYTVFKKGKVLVSAGGSKLSGKDITVPSKVTDPKTKKSYTVTEVEDGGFYNTKIKSIKLPESVTVIGTDSFSNCKSLKTISVTKKLKYIGLSAFEGSKSTTVKFAGTAKQWAAAFKIPKMNLYNGNSSAKVVCSDAKLDPVTTVTSASAKTSSDKKSVKITAKTKRKITGFVASGYDGDSYYKTTYNTKGKTTFTVKTKSKSTISVDYITPYIVVKGVKLFGDEYFF